MSHEHTVTSSHKITPDFALHPKLYSWLVQYLKLKEPVNIEAREMGCADDSCPIIETIFTIEQGNNKQFFKVARAIKNISKNDIYFSVQKQVL